MKKVTFAIGIGFDKHGKHIEAYRREKKIIDTYRALAESFGGYSANEVSGGWINPEGELVTENSLVIDIYTDAAPEVIRDTAEWLATLFNQESVMVAIQPVESLTFVPQGKKVA